MSNVEQPTHDYKRYDDQLRVNTALDSMQPVWEGNRTLMNVSLDDEWTSTTREGFKVTILAERDVCRKNCTSKSLKQCYVWHRVIPGDKKLENGDIYLGPWFLRKDWEEISARSNAIREEWLNEITI